MNFLTYKVSVGWEIMLRMWSKALSLSLYMSIYFLEHPGPKCRSSGKLEDLMEVTNCGHETCRGASTSVPCPIHKEVLLSGVE